MSAAREAHLEFPTSTGLRVRDLRKSFGTVKALDGISLDVKPGEFFSLLGQSGCGKTTLLRILAGLEQPEAGTVSLDGRDLLGFAAHERPVNTVFQSYALFPHLNVRENVGFGLRMKKTPKAELSRRVEAMLDMVEVGPLATRRPHELSGGQRQRVALARALVNEPRLLLLDEPLAAVDQKLRKQLQADLHALQRRVGLTFVYVTHDQEEALSLSDRLAVMNHGRIEQVGAPREIYDAPGSRFVAEFVGHCNLLDAEISGTMAKTSLGTIAVTPGTPNGKATLFFRPERVLVEDATPGASLDFKGIVRHLTFTGPETHLGIESHGAIIRAALLNRSGDYRVGQTVRFGIPSEAVRVL